MQPYILPIMKVEVDLPSLAAFLLIQRNRILLTSHSLLRQAENDA